ncbi:MAG: hypothetical protein RL708_1148 [Bacteroidota bacterium]
MNWLQLTDENQLDSIIKESFNKPQILFKHSTRCSISRMALSKTERNWSFSSEQISPFYLDLLEHKNISNEIANRFKVEHQSPQMLLIKDGKCVFTSTHNDIDIRDVEPLI